MRTTLALCAIFVLVFFMPSALAADSGGSISLTTQQRIEKFSKELVETWEKYPTENQKSVRIQVLQDINAVFQREITKAEAPKDKKISQLYATYLSRLEKATDLFKVEKMKTERTNYIKGCSTAFKREYVFATDYSAERTPQKCFDTLMDMLEEARDRFVPEKEKDIRADAFQSCNMLFTDTLNKSKVPDGVDHAAAMDKNIKDARVRFPTNIEALKAKNGPAYALCETAAKAVKQRALSKQN